MLRLRSIVATTLDITSGTSGVGIFDTPSFKDQLNISIYNIRYVLTVRYVHSPFVTVRFFSSDIPPSFPLTPVVMIQKVSSSVP